MPDSPFSILHAYICIKNFSWLYVLKLTEFILILYNINVYSFHYVSNLSTLGSYI